MAAAAVIIAASARRRAEERSRYYAVSNVLSASPAFCEGHADALKYVNQAYDEKALTNLADEKGLDLTYRSFHSLWLKKETPAPEQRDQIDTLARGMLREQFKLASSNAIGATAWYAAIHSSAVRGSYGADAKQAEKLDNATLYRLGFEAFLGRTAVDVHDLNPEKLAKGRPSPERSMLRQALAQRNAQLARRFDQDVEKGVGVLKN